MKYYVPTIELGQSSGAAIHLDPYDPVLFLEAVDATQLDNIGIRLRSDKVLSLRVYVYGYTYDWFVSSTAYHYLRGIAEALQIKFYVSCQSAPFSNKRRRIGSRPDEVYFINFTDQTYKSKLQRLMAVPKFQPSHVKHPKR